VTYETFLDEVCARSGLASREAAERAVRATLDLVGERLSAADARGLAEQLPGPLSRLLAAPRRHAAFDVLELYEHVKETEPVRLGIAVEHARVVCEVLAEALDAEGLALLRARLPAEWASLFRPRTNEGASAEPPGPPAGSGHTLASGRPGSRHPLSEAGPPAAQSESVVQTENPHADEKLSSAPGPRPGRPLASESPGSDRPLSEARDPLERSSRRR
jgi:uncharacterized protein (DUF2267 family)